MLMPEDPGAGYNERRPRREASQTRLRLWRTRSIYAIGAFSLSCVIVYLFLKGHALHAYWENFGEYLIVLSEALLLVLVYCVGLWWAAWQTSRDSN